MKKIKINRNPPTLPPRLGEAGRAPSLENGGLKNGFTLVELLVVIAIISILTIISLSSFTNAQVKARDAQRKSDLEQTSKALMLYYSDVGSFPNLTSNRLFGNSAVGFTGANGIVYMRKTPLDPKNNGDYVYVYKTDGKIFNLFANLENKKDSQCNGSYTISGVSGNFCYGISSPNAVLKTW